MDNARFKLSSTVWKYLTLFFLSTQLLGVCKLTRADTESGCRIAQGNSSVTYTQDMFNTRSCSICYKGITGVHTDLLVRYILTIDEESGMLMDYYNITYEPDPSNTTGIPRGNIKWSHTASQWSSCCERARECCDQMLLTNAASTTSGGEESTGCSSVWDFYGGCWPALKTNESEELECTDFTYSYFSKPPCKQGAKRKCLESDVWNTEVECYSFEFHRILPELPPAKTRNLNPSAEAYSGMEMRNISVNMNNGVGILADEEDRVCCRNERRILLSKEAFRYDTCARCYSYMPKRHQNPRYQFSLYNGAIYDKNTNEYALADCTNESNIIYNLFEDQSLTFKLLQCCQKATHCCNRMLETPLRDKSESPFCPRTWDGWQCFPDTEPGTIAYSSCPDYIYFSQNIYAKCQNPAEKRCMSHGAWFRKVEDPTREYTDYTPCGSLSAQVTMEHFTVACFVISLVSLLPALIIFSSYRQLRVARIQMHRNFFLALLFNGIFTIAYRAYVLLPELDSSLSANLTTIAKNGAGCKILLVFTRYFRMCSYTWMLCEGFYLQRLITAAFAEQKKLYVFYIIGWVFPTLPVAAYAIGRKLTHDEQCWAGAGNLEWVLGSINLSCILLNLVFLFNIIRVLVTKLRSIQTNEPSHFRKAVRATLVLIPLFGAHFVLYMYNIPSDSDSSCTARLVYRYFKAAIDGLQGFVVAVIFCYMNGEILYLLRRSYERYKVRHGLQGSATRSRLSMSTQMSQAQDIHLPNSKTGPPLANGTSGERNGSVSLNQNQKADSDENSMTESAGSPRVPPSINSQDDNKDFGFVNVELNNEKVTEL